MCNSHPILQHSLVRVLLRENLEKEHRVVIGTDWPRQARHFLTQLKA